MLLLKVLCQFQVIDCFLQDTKTLQRPTLLLILKWGGELTPAGRKQAEDLGRAFRCMYPGGKGTNLCCKALN